MVDLKKTSDALCRLAAENGAQGFSATVFTREKQELNTENDQFSLYRTTFDHGAALTVLTEGRKGAASGNDLSDEGLAALASSAMASAASSQPDEANAIAPCQGSHTFHNGPFAPDMPRFYDRLTEFLAAVARDYPQVKLMAMIADHTATHTLYANHNGTVFENFDGVYHVVLEFAGNDGARTTGFHDAAVAFHDLDTPIMALGNVAQALRDAQDSLTVAATPDKFVGPIIMTPALAQQAAAMLVDVAMSGNVIMAGTSLWRDSIGKAVASDKVTLRLAVDDDRLAERDPFTSDGFLSREVTLIEKGVLRSHCLDLYAAGKSGRPVTANDGATPIMEPGDDALSDMIASIDCGLLVGGFSGGHPGANGELSGVAKNSFLIRHGKIVGAVSETMISCNLLALFRSVSAVSREAVCSGDSVFPYVKCEGVTVSGK